MFKVHHHHSNEFEATQILPNIWLGNQHDATMVDELKSRGISYILNVADDVPTPPTYNQFYYCRLDVKDGGRDSGISRVFPYAIKFVDLAGDNGVLIHCKYGTNRSPTIAAVIVQHKLGIPMEQAYQYVADRRHIHILKDNMKQLGF